MVRELDREARVVHHVLVDIAASMRPIDSNEPERSRLGHAVELAAGYARSALAAGERVGLITYDGLVHRHLRPDDRASTWGAIAERLMEAMHPVDADFTELTDGELVAAVARYLRHQESCETRLAAAPPIDDVKWSQVATGPAGELYDLAELAAVVDRLLARASRRPDRGPGPSRSAMKPTDPLTDRLRQLCRLRSIELPYRRTTDLRRRATGLATALELAARDRGPQRIVILSDLGGLDGPLGPLERVAALTRRRGLRPLCLVPSGRAYSSIPPGERADRAATIFSWDEGRRESHARRNLQRLGFRVVPIAPGERLAQVLARCADARARSPLRA